MLARLNEIEGVVSVESDHYGELLQLRLCAPAALDTVHAALRELGYDAETVAAPTPLGERWYDAARVGELSREEAKVIARRVVPPVATAHGLSAAQADRMRDAVAGALYRCFTARGLGRALVANLWQDEQTRDREEQRDG